MKVFVHFWVFKFLVLAALIPSDMSISFSLSLVERGIVLNCLDMPVLQSQNLALTEFGNYCRLESCAEGIVQQETQKMDTTLLL